MTGVIAVDIDGTLVAEDYQLPTSVFKCLENCVLNGWRLCVITGRTYTWATKVLGNLPFPYYLIVQNGALIYSMPEKELRTDQLLNKDILKEALRISNAEGTGLVVYDRNDRAYFIADHFDEELLAYIRERKRAHNEDWKEISSLEELTADGIVSMKCFGDKKLTNIVASRLREGLGLAVPHIRDPFREGFYVSQATHNKANKGQALSWVLKRYEVKGPVIVAGDDRNDESMLALADVKIVMATAPEEMLSSADIIAPPASAVGIVEGIQKALDRVS